MSNTGYAAGRHGVSCTQMSAAQDLALFDRLPPVLREAIRNCRTEMSSYSVLKALGEGFPVQGLVRLIAASDRENSQIWQMQEFGEVWCP